MVRRPLELAACRRRIYFSFVPAPHVTRPIMYLAYRCRLQDRLTIDRVGGSSSKASTRVVRFRISRKEPFEVCRCRALFPETVRFTENGSPEYREAIRPASFSTYLVSGLPGISRFLHLRLTAAAHLQCPSNTRGNPRGPCGHHGVTRFCVVAPVSQIPLVCQLRIQALGRWLQRDDAKAPVSF